MAAVRYTKLRPHLNIPTLLTEAPTAFYAHATPIYQLHPTYTRPISLFTACATLRVHPAVPNYAIRYTYAAFRSTPSIDGNDKLTAFNSDSINQVYTSTVGVHPPQVEHSPQPIATEIRKHRYTAEEGDPPLNTIQGSGTAANNNQDRVYQPIIDLFYKLCERISAFFGAKLLFANCFAVTALFVAGDLICQISEDAAKYNQWSASRIDYLRTLRIALFACFINGPCYTWWYGHVIKQYVLSKPQTLYYKAFLPMLADTFLFGPVLIVFFHYFISALSGDTWKVTKEKLWSDVPFVLLADFISWPPIQLANFAVIPAKFQGVVVSIADFFWAIFLSWSSSNKRTREGVTTAE